MAMSVESTAPIDFQGSARVNAGNEKSTSTPNRTRMGSTYATSNRGTSTKARVERHKEEASSILKRLCRDNIAALPKLVYPWSESAKEQSEALVNAIHSNLECSISKLNDTPRKTTLELVELLGSATREQNEQALSSIISQWTRHGNRDGVNGAEPEKVLYPMLAALVVYVAIHVRKKHVKYQPAVVQTDSKAKTPTSTSGIDRLLLPPNTGDFKPGGFDEDFKIDSALSIHAPDDNIRLQTRPHCRDILAIVESKQAVSMLDEALEQIVRYSRNIYSAQHNRRFVWALTVCSTQVHACLLLHDAVLVSETMDIALLTGRKQLIELFVNWSMCDQSQLGYDPSFHYNAIIGKWIVDCFDDDAVAAKQTKRKRQLQQQHKQKRHKRMDDAYPFTQYRVDYSLFTANSVEGRHTRCFVAEECDRNGNSISGTEVVIKDAWAAIDNPLEDDPRSEIKILQTISDTLEAKPKINHLYPKLVHGGHVRFMVDGEMQPDTTNMIFKLLGTKRLDRPEIDAPETQQLQSQCFDADDVFSSSPRSTLKPDWRYQPLRAHRRIVMTPIGNHIHQVETQEELIIVLADAMRCHRSIYKHCGILHRDISENNILMVRSNKDASIHGLLIDYDYSVALSTKNRGKRPGRSGTLPFMSIGNLENNSTQRTQLDDWESLLYLLCWTATIGLISEKRYEVCHEDKKTKQSKLSKLPIHHWREGGVNDIAETKRIYMHSEDNFIANIRKHFHGEYDQLKQLAAELHQALFLHERCKGALILGTSSDEPLVRRVEYEDAIVRKLKKVMSRYRKKMIKRLL